MKTMKSTVARLFALCLTVAMVLSMATMGAFAGTTPITKETQTGTINIRGTDRDVNTPVSLYQIITVNLDETTLQPKNPVYQWVTPVADWLKGSKYAKYIDTENSNAVTEVFSTKTDENPNGETAANLSLFYADLASAIEGKEVQLTAKATDSVSGTTAADVEKMPLGQYLIIAEDTGSYEHKPATATLYPQWGDHDGKPETNETWYVEDANVALKGDKGTVDKEPNKPTVSIGDEVTYTVKASVPVYPEGATATEFNVGDKMGTGLTWNKDEGVTVYWSSDGVTYSGNKVDPKYYDLVPDAVVKVNNKETKVTFQVEFKYKELVAKYADAKYVHVEYTATINEHAFVEDALGNDAYLGVNTNPYDGGSYETTPTEEDVYTYGFTVTKVGEDGKTLPDVEFKLYSDEACANEIKFVDKGNGVYTKATEEQITSNKNIADALVTNKNGQFQVQGLDCATYYLKETKAADGYVLPGDIITVTLVDNEPDGKLDDCTVTGSTVLKKDPLVSPLIIGEDNETIKEGNNIFEFQVKNDKPGFNLPTTGGMGTVLFTAGGLVIMACGAALVLVTLKKKKAED